MWADEGVVAGKPGEVEVVLQKHEVTDVVVGVETTRRVGHKQRLDACKTVRTKPPSKNRTHTHTHTHTNKEWVSTHQECKYAPSACVCVRVREPTKLAKGADGQRNAAQAVALVEMQAALHESGSETKQIGCKCVEDEKRSKQHRNQ